ncbi:FAD-binding oxidoreductase [Stappia sp.]|uniref:FAD-binding oxidoreductase n=1 Tax=Stappia sp. TaxID=1870903 RepID=UPI003C7A35AA
MSDIAAVKAALEGLAIEDNPQIVRQKSRDFFWYSPVLKRQLDEVTADIVVNATSEADVIRVLKACYAHDVPVTTRGAGTGNYGQAMPLSGGVVLNLAEMNKVLEVARGSVRAEAGAIMSAIDAAAHESGQELRMHPSTHRTATIGGFVAGGSGGIGSINWGGLRDFGNILSLRVVTMEEEPRVLTLSGSDLHKVSHAYGTNGIITEVTMPLTASYDWVDVLVGFESFADAASFADALANQDGILTKEIAPISAPIPHAYFLRHKKFLRSSQSVCAIMVAPFAMDAFAAFLGRRAGAELVYRSDEASQSDLKSLPPVPELTWNHTTLRGLRVDPTITYLQVLYPFPDHVKKAVQLAELFGDEVLGHLEFVRFDGKITCFGLPIVRYTTEERLDEIIRIHEDHGCPIFNPHRYTLEEGGMKQTDAVQLAFKKEADPKGLLNPGKMIAWENPDFDFSSNQTYLFPGLS